MQKACPGCGKLKQAYALAKRTGGTAKCHGCIQKRKSEKPTKRVTRSATKRNTKNKKG